MSGQRDPTRSLGLRRQGRAHVNRRVFELHRGLRQTLQEYDLAGLRTRENVPIAFINWVEAVDTRLQRAEGMVQQIIGQVLIGDGGWLGDLVFRAIVKGVDQANAELKMGVAQDFDARDVLAALAFEAETEIRGISAETERRVMRNTVHAVHVHATPDQLMRDVRRTLETVTRLRLLLLVNYAVVKAVNAGKLFVYKQNGIVKVGIEPEWRPAHLHKDAMIVDARTRKRKAKERRARNKAKRQRQEPELDGDEILVNVLTAGDDKVCEECGDIAAEGPYDIETAGELIPAHPNCRCAFVPFADLRFAPIMEQEEEWE